MIRRIAASSLVITALAVLAVSLFADYARKYDQESYTSGTSGECDFIEREIKSDKKTRILDIGCGTGASTLVLARELDAEIIAIDFLLIAFFIAAPFLRDYPAYLVKSAGNHGRDGHHAGGKPGRHQCGQGFLS